MRNEIRNKRKKEEKKKKKRKKKKSKEGKEKRKKEKRERKEKKKEKRKRNNENTPAKLLSTKTSFFSGNSRCSVLGSSMNGKPSPPRNVQSEKATLWRLATSSAG
jgi:hypothetical protein